MQCVADVAYYSPHTPYLNTSLILSEISAIERALPSLVINRITGLVILHPNVEVMITLSPSPLMFSSQSL